MSTRELNSLGKGEGGVAAAEDEQERKMRRREEEEGGVPLPKKRGEREEGDLASTKVSGPHTCKDGKAGVVEALWLILW